MDCFVAALLAMTTRVAAAIAVSAVVHHTIEAPLHDLGRRLSKASGKRLASAPAN
jgi:peptidoglycan/LPS O-acetylase OafA/YrhL